MESQDKCAVLADKINNVLSSGVVLDSDAAHYIDSTFSNPSLAELESILNDDTNCEKDSLMELLFFPDESMQMQLEELLQTLELHQQDEQQVLACLCKVPLHVPFRFADDRGSLRLLLPEAVAGQFLSRLRIGKHLERKLLVTVNKHGDKKDITRFKVKIRNSRFALTSNRLGILCAFFEKIGSKSNDVLECLEFMLDFLEELNDDCDLYQALMAKKKFYFLNLQKARQLERQLQHTNMETFLLQGKRVVLIDPADARKKMHIIDRVSQALCGKSEYFEPPESNEKTTVWLKKNGFA